MFYSKWNKEEKTEEREKKQREKINLIFFRKY